MATNQPSKETLAKRKKFRQETKAKMADTLLDLTRMEKETLLETLLEWRRKRIIRKFFGREPV